jgi:protein-tyrosine-phosphatase
MLELPGSILFACNHNAIRSPMAEGLMKYLHGLRLYVQSAGVRPGELDPFAVAVMDEIGIDIARHHPHSFEDLEDAYFDLVISLAPEAQHRAVELTRATATELEFWNTPDPTLVEGSREVRLDAYRQVRDFLMRRIQQRFPTPGGRGD